MAGDWREVTLGDVADLVRGVSYRPPDLLADGSKGIALLRATNIRDRALEFAEVLFVPPALVRESQLLRRFDVVIAMSSGSRDAVGRLAQLRKNWIGCVGAFCGVIRANPERVHPEFVGYVLQSPEFRARIDAYAVGTAIMNLSRERILGFPIRLPSLPEQRAIAHILGTLDDKIELNRRMSEILEAMARALFKSWFVDFGPVRAKMDGRDAGLPKHIADLFPDRLVDSELGEIPEGWEVHTLGDLLELAYGKALKAEERRNGTVPVFGSNGQVGWHDERLAVGPGIVVGRKGNPGVVTWAPVEYFVIDTAFYVVPKGPCSSLHFLFHALRTHDLASLGADSAVPGLNRNLAYMSRQFLPPKEVVGRFEELAASVTNRVHQLDVDCRTLASIRDALLPKLVSGEVRVA